MPIARFKGVLICSSEDKNYPASNLINGSLKKWKCQESGLDSVYVVLQFECPTKINAIDIGNENSTFIEVAVGKNGWPIEKFKTILMSSSFMTLPESRVSENPNRVRCFNKESFMPDVLDEKWDLVKVACTQTGNKHAQFGLSFIKISTPDVIPTTQKQKKSSDDTLTLPKNSVFSQFRVRSDSSDSDKESQNSSSLFSKWKKEKDSPQKEPANGQSSAAAIREASSSMMKLEECTKINRKVDTPKSSSKPRKSDESDRAELKKKRTDRYRPAILYDDDDEDENKSNPKLEKAIEQDNERNETQRQQWLDKKKPKNQSTHSREEKSKQKMESSSDKFKMFVSNDIADKSLDQAKSTNANIIDDAERENVVDGDDDGIVSKSPTEDDSNDIPNSSATGPITPSHRVWKTKRASTSNEEHATKRTRTSPKENGQILEGVVFVISGIQNPERANMRENGLKMGAKYKPDWDDSCTHLICAFPNTPKYKQVQGHGIIVNKNWIDECFAAKKKLPWRDYEL